MKIREIDMSIYIAIISIILFAMGNIKISILFGLIATIMAIIERHELIKIYIKNKFKKNEN